MVNVILNETIINGIDKPEAHINMSPGNKICLSKNNNIIGSGMVREFTLNAVDIGFNPLSNQAKDNKISVCCFPISIKYPTKHHQF